LWSPVTPQFLTYAHPIALPATTGSILLSFQTWSNTENSLEWDMHGVEVREISAPTWTALKLSFDSQYWRLDTRDLTPWAGQTIELRFNFNAVDESWNDEQGWFLDDVKIVEDAVNTVAMDACSSDSSWLLQCPCSNSGGAGRGCKSSVSDTGAGISASGAMRVSADTLVLHVDGMSEAAATVFQASGFTHSNSVALAGDGLSCVTGSFVRLVTRYAPGGVLDFPGPGDAPLSLIGGVSAGQTLYYGARYRDAATFCGAPTYNMSNTISAFWRP
jgi:hypothetical protein